MKSKIKFYTLIFVSILLINVGCKKVLDINQDPNNPSNANPEQILPAAQVELATSLGNQYVTVASRWAQYWTGGPGVSISPLEAHTMVGGDINRAWGNTYARGLNDLNQLVKGDQPVYAGIAKILMAYTYGTLVDLHGSVPYSEALKGAIEDGGILTPKFDDDEAVYSAIEALIDEALINIQETGATVKIPSSDDLIYGGKISKWIAFANTLKLKLLIKHGMVTPSKLDDALRLFNSGASFIDGSNGAKVFFSGSTLGSSNPLWANFESRTATLMYMRATTTSTNLLTSLSDPRISKFYTAGTNGFSGIDPGATDKPPYVGTPAAKYAQPNTTYVYNKSLPVWLLSPWESYFLQAELAIKKSLANDSILFADGINASFSHFGIPSSDLPVYLTNLSSSSYSWGTTESQKLKALAVQKWISMNGLQMTEGWIEAKRFDIESTNSIIFRGVGGLFINPEGNSLGTNIYPSSYVYGSNEVSYNPNTPARVITDKVFWDN